MPLMITQVQGGQLALCDENGVILGIIDDSGTKLLQTTARLRDGTGFYNAAKQEQLPAALIGGRLDENVGAWLGSTAPTVGQKTMAASVPVVIANDQIPVQVNVVSYSNVQALVAEYLKNGAAYNMRVNGSGTPQVFQYLCDATKDVVVHELRFIFSCANFAWSGMGFGKSATVELANGILLELVVNNGFAITLNTIKINEDFLRTFGENPVTDSAGNSVVLVASYRFGGTLLLKGGTSDKIKVTIRDDLTSGSLGVNYLSATVFGDKLA